MRLVLSEIRVLREQRQMLTNGLPYQHAVKRVFVLESRQLISGRPLGTAGVALEPAQLSQGQCMLAGHPPRALSVAEVVAQATAGTESPLRGLVLSPLPRGIGARLSVKGLLQQSLAPFPLPEGEGVEGSVAQGIISYPVSSPQGRGSYGPP